MSTIFTLHPALTQFLEEINRANRYPALESDTHVNSLGITYDENSGLFRLTAEKNITDSYFTSHDSETFVLRFGTFITSLERLMQTGQTTVLQRGIRVNNRGYHDSAISMDEESKLLIQRGIIQGELQLTGRKFSKYDLKFQGIGMASAMEGPKEYIPEQDIERAIEPFFENWSK